MTSNSSIHSIFVKSFVLHEIQPNCMTTTPLDSWDLLRNFGNYYRNEIFFGNKQKRSRFKEHNRLLDQLKLKPQLSLTLFFTEFQENQ